MMVRLSPPGAGPPTGRKNTSRRTARIAWGPRFSHCPGTVFEDHRRRSIVNPVKTAVVHRRLADQLWQADQTAVPIPPLTDQHPDLSIEDAYAIQSVNIDRRVQNGGRGCGRKKRQTSQPREGMVGGEETAYGGVLGGRFF